MENNYIYDFLSLKSENDEKRLMKTWLGLLISFTVVFMDIGFLLNFLNEKRFICIPIAFTLFVLVLYVIYFIIAKGIKKHITYSILYNAVVTAISELLFYVLFLLYIISKKLSFSMWYIIAVLISLMIILSALVYRSIEFKSNKKKKYKSNRCSFVIPVVFLILPISKILFNKISESLILTIAFLLLGGLWLLVSLIYWQNYYYGKKNNIDEIYFNL